MKTSWLLTYLSQGKNKKDKCEVQKELLYYNIHSIIQKIAESKVNETKANSESLVNCNAFHVKQSLKANISSVDVYIHFLLKVMEIR